MRISARSLATRRRPRQVVHIRTSRSHLACDHWHTVIIRLAASDMFRPYGAISGLLHSDRADLEPRGGERSCIRYAKSERYPIERVNSCPHNYGAGSRVLIEAGTFVYENGV